MSDTRRSFLGKILKGVAGALAVPTVAKALMIPEAEADELLWTPKTQIVVPTRWPHKTWKSSWEITTSLTDEDIQELVGYTMKNLGRMRMETIAEEIGNFFWGPVHTTDHLGLGVNFLTGAIEI